MIPLEILEFLRAPGLSLLVKGRAGTGKTLFALALARAYQSERGDVVWADSREADPGAAEALDAIVPEAQRLRVADAAPVPAGSAPGAARGVDAASALAVLDELAEAAAECSRPLLVVDSLDGLTEGLTPREKARFVVAAVRVARELPASLILVTESATADPVDYLVDGIVHAQERHEGGARLRELHLDKLRGVAIPRTAYAFTLTQGRFTAFVPEPVDGPSSPVRPHPLTPGDGCVSSGIADWDALLGGGFRQGSVQLVQQGPRTSRMHDRLIVPLAIHTLNAGRGLVYVPTPSDASRELRAAVQPHVDSRRDHEPLLFTAASESLTRPLRFGDDHSMDPDEGLAPLEGAREEYRARGPVTSVIGVDAVTFAFGPDAALRWLARWTSLTRARGDVDVLIARADDHAGVVTLADAVWRVESVHDVPFVRGLVPSTEYHHVAHSTHRGFPETRWIPLH